MIVELQAPYRLSYTVGSQQMYEITFTNKMFCLDINQSMSRI